MNPTHRRATALVVALALLSLLVVAAPTAAAGNETATANATNVTYASGGFTGAWTNSNGTVRTNGSTVYLWRNATYDVGARYEATGENVTLQACLAYPKVPNATERCQPVSTANEPTKVVFADETWPKNASESGPVRLTLEQTGPNVTQVLDTRTLTLETLTREGDLDSDGLTNAEEIRHNTDFTATDTDNDGLQDGPEVHEYGTNPLVADTDGDGVRDAVEINRGTDPQKADTDGDGLSDKREAALGTNPTVSDTDGDGLSDGAEVNEYGTNPTASDTDGDGLSDGREVVGGSSPTSVDTDGDHVSDATEYRLGTSPSSPWSPLGWVVLAAVGLVAVAARVVVAKRDIDPVVLLTERARTRSARSAERANGQHPPPTPPQTDEERVIDMLEAANGQLRQRRIVENTDWSKAKVSRVLAEMDAEGRVTKIRLGRENLICLPGREPTGTRRRANP